MNKIYIASSLHNIARVKSLMELFEEKGAVVTYNWAQHGQVFTNEELRKYGEAELDGVMAADLLFFVQPGRMGSHVELGVMLALVRLGKPKTIVILEESQVEQKSFYHLEHVNRFHKEEDAIKFSLERLGL